MKQAFGVRRLDELTDGGLEERTFTLLHGPPFSGKDLLARRFLLTGLEQGIPCVNILTSESPGDARDALSKLDSRYPKYEAAGLVRFVDAYSPQIGAETTPDPHTIPVDSLTNFNGLMRASEDAMGELARTHEHQRIVLNSLSVLALNTNLQTTFRFLQVFVGRARRSGAAGLLLADEGMHSGADLHAYKTLVKGAIETKRENERHYMRIDGLQLTANPGWIEYSFDQQHMELIGSFAGGRIR